jgi:hypothetical protein
MLPSEVPELTFDYLATSLREYFRKDDDLMISVERLPFAKQDSLALRWGDWLTRVSLDEGARVRQESIEIHRSLGNSAPDGLAEAHKRLRVVFGDDPGNEYTNQMIDMFEYLKSIDGAIVFDPQQGDLVP